MIPIIPGDVLSEADQLRTSGARGHSAITRGHGWHNHCLEHVRRAVGAPPMGGTAFEAWLRAPQNHRHRGPAPKGFPAVYRSLSGGAGHIVVSRGTSGCNTNDAVRDGDLDVVSWAELEHWLGHNYVYEGYLTQLNGRDITAPAPKPYPAHTVSLKKVRDNALHHTASADAKVVKGWLHAEGLLNSWWRTSTWGRFTTKPAYRVWQQSDAGGNYSGNDADGIPGHDSLTRLAHRHNGKVAS